MAQDGSLQGQGGFDLDSPSGVARVLAAVRASDISSDVKNELRDAVFLYSNGGHDPSVRSALEQKLNELKLTVAPSNTAASSKPVQPSTTMGSSRGTPSFSVPATPTPSAAPVPATPAPIPPQPQPTPTPTPTPQPESVPAPQPATPAPEVVQPVAPTPPPVVPTQPTAASAPSQPATQATPVPTSPQPAPAPASVPSQATAPIPPQPQPTSSPAPAPTPTPTPTPQPEPTPSPQPATPPVEPEAAFVAKSQEEYLQRIRDIKAQVNEKVGNPVNLVDIDNTIGREYMSSLLEAMKKINSGVSAVSAMQRLEDSFVAVKAAIAKHEANPIPPPPASVPEPIQTPPPPPPVPEPVMQTPPPPPKSDPKSEVETPPPPQIPPQLEKIEVPVAQSTPPPAPTGSKLPPLNRKQAVDSNTPAWGSDTDTVKAPSASTSTQKPSLASLADAKVKPRNPNELQTAATVNTSADGDPLFTKEVTDGLNQLLSEWPLFKKSGLFGTGPKGLEHPLFKKLAPMQIPLLLAGRFEGATQEIKQSITDYMNGWRYEQGIIYQQGETFEHYLRRVIRHIIDLQKKKSSS